MPASCKETFYFSVVYCLDGRKQQEIHTVITCCEEVAITALVDELRERWGPNTNWTATILRVTELEYDAIRARLQQALESRREKQSEQALLN